MQIGIETRPPVPQVVFAISLLIHIIINFWYDKYVSVFICTKLSISSVSVGWHYITHSQRDDECGDRVTERGSEAGQILLQVSRLKSLSKGQSTGGTELEYMYCL